jgi:hypothetical protein
MGLRATATFKPTNQAAFVAKIAAGATQGVLNAAQAGYAISQAIVPKVTGDLATDITVKSGADDTSAWAAWGPDSIPYRFYVEYGTGKRGAESAQAGPGPYKESWPGMTPRPYQRPAMDEINGQVLDIVASSIKSAL